MPFGLPIFSFSILNLFSEDQLIIYDSLNFQVLQSCIIPSKIRHSYGQITAKIISCDSHGRILLRWGSYNVHFWNFGTRINQLERRKGSIDRTPHRVGKAEIARNLRDDLEAFNDELDELEQTRRLEEKYSVAGMNEAEMLRLAEMLSLEPMASTKTGPDGADNNARSRQRTSSDLDSEFEFQLALTLSLSEHQK